MQHLSNTLDAAQVAQFTPEAIARYAAICTREAVSGNFEAHQTREAIIDAWMRLKGYESRAQAISDLTAIQIQARIDALSVANDSRP